MITRGENPPMATGNDSSDEDSASWERAPSAELGRISPGIFDEHDGEGGGRGSDPDESIAIGPGPDRNLGYAADAHIEAELAKMSLAEREKVHFDVHGISGPPRETPELVRSSLREFQVAIDDLLLAARGKPDPAERDGTDPGLRGIFSTRAYEMALSTDPAYVEDRGLRLAFLRREKFVDRVAAARRFVQWFSVKLGLFGPDLLTETITQDDLASFEGDDPDAFGSTTNEQVLPLRDNAGRLVFCELVANSRCDISRSWKVALRRRFYMFMVAAEDPETQFKGAIIVWYAVGAKDATSIDDWNYMRAKFAVLDCLPIRIEAIHSCHNSHWNYAAKVAVFRLTCGMFLSARTRCHVGPHHRCLFVLQTYGVPVAVMPLAADGSYEPRNERNALLWAQRREYERRHLFKRDGNSPDDHGNKKDAMPNHEPDPEDKERSPTDDDIINSLLGDADMGLAFDFAENERDTKCKGTTSDSQEAGAVVETHAETTAVAATNVSQDRPATILLPGQFDVLLGRGSGYHCHAGNIRLRGLIGPKVDAHAACSTVEEKVRMTLEIVQEVKAHGGRFLKQGDMGWTEVSDREARHKVGHTFRNMRPAAMKNDNRKKVSKRMHSLAA